MGLSRSRPAEELFLQLKTGDLIGRPYTFRAQSHWRPRFGFAEQSN